MHPQERDHNKHLCALPAPALVGGAGSRHPRDYGEDPLSYNTRSQDNSSLGPACQRRCTLHTGGTCQGRKPVEARTSGNRDKTAHSISRYQAKISRKEVPSVPGRAHVQQQEAQGGPVPINTAQQLEGVQGTKPQAQGCCTGGAECLLAMYLFCSQER